MTVEVNVDRKAVEITWDTELVKGEKAHIVATNPDNGDTSTRDTENDGRATLTYPADYSGSSEVLVNGSDSGFDIGTIEV